MGAITQPCTKCSLSSDKTGGDDLKPFREFLTEQYGSDFNKAFEELSAGKANLSQAQFLRLAKKAGYVGDAAAVFAALDADESGKISVEEFEAMQSEAKSSAALAVKQFKDFLKERFKTPQSAFAAVAKDENSRVSRQEFIAKLKDLGFKGNSDSVFTSLDFDQDGFVSIEEFKGALKGKDSSKEAPKDLKNERRGSKDDDKGIERKGSKLDGNERRSSKSSDVDKKEARRDSKGKDGEDKENKLIEEEFHQDEKVSEKVDEAEGIPAVEEGEDAKEKKSSKEKTRTSERRSSAPPNFVVEKDKDKGKDKEKEKAERSISKEEERRSSRESKDGKDKEDKSREGKRRNSAPVKNSVKAKEK